MSLDGFVAGPNGEMNWITVNEEIFDYVGKRISKTDTAMALTDGSDVNRRGLRAYRPLADIP